MTIRRAAAAAALAVLALGAGCSRSKNLFQMGLPGVRLDVTVTEVSRRGGVLDVWLEMGGWALRTFLPANEACTEVVASAGGAQWLTGPPFGALLRGELRCEAAGIGSLRLWRDKRPRGDHPQALIPSAQARYQGIFQDDTVAFLRGRFSLASRLGVGGTHDLIAVVPLGAACSDALARGTAMLEFFPAGKKVLTLVSGEGRCPIEGLIQPAVPLDFEARPS